MVSEAFSSIGFEYLEAEEVFNQRQTDLANLKGEILQWKKFDDEKQDEMIQKRHQLEETHALTQQMALLRIEQATRKTMSSNPRGRYATNKGRHQLEIELFAYGNRLRKLEHRRDADVDLLLLKFTVELRDIANEVQSLESKLPALGKQKAAAERKYSYYRALTRPPNMPPTEKGEVASVSNKSVVPPKKQKQMRTPPIKRPENGGVSSTAKKSVISSKKHDSEDHWVKVDMTTLKIPKWIKKDSR